MPDSRQIEEFELQVLTLRLGGKIADLAKVSGAHEPLLTMTAVSLDTVAEDGRSAESRLQILTATFELLKSICRSDRDTLLETVTEQVGNLHTAWSAAGEAARLQATIKRVTGSPSTGLTVFAILCGHSEQVRTLSDSVLRHVAAIRRYIAVQPTV
jgi:hypothetical protein